jgi:hypothetical protein
VDFWSYGLGKAWWVYLGFGYNVVNMVSKTKSNLWWRVSEPIIYVQFRSEFLERLGTDQRSKTCKTGTPSDPKKVSDSTLCKKILKVYLASTRTPLLNVSGMGSGLGQRTWRRERWPGLIRGTLKRERSCMVRTHMRGTGRTRPGRQKADDAGMDFPNVRRI